MIENKEARRLLEKANVSLEEAYKNVRIALSDIRDEYIIKDLKIILIEIDRQQLAITGLLYPAKSDVETFRFNTEEDGITVSKIFSEANHI